MIQLERHCRQIECIHPYTASHFISISPITFNSTEQLSKLLSKYGDTNGYDNSQANKAYFLARNYDNVSCTSFEHQRYSHKHLEVLALWLTTIRLLLKILQNVGSGYEGVDLEKFNIANINYFQNIGIHSFLIHTWDKDYRSKDEIAKNPRILDIGWTDWIIDNGATGSSSADIVVERNASEDT